MKVRKATKDDLPKIVEMGLAFFNDTKHAAVVPYNAEAVERISEQLMQDERAGAVFIAHTENGEIIGATAGILFPLWMAPEHITGQEMFWYVMPEHRKSKAGSLLFAALEEWAANNSDSFCMVALSHMHENRIGQMYESKGYVPLERTYIKVL